MTPYAPYLEPVTASRDRMVELAVGWAKINSGSYHREGLAAMLSALSDAFAVLGGQQEYITIYPQQQVNAQGKIEERELGRALRIRKRPDAPVKVFLGGHMDTVFAADHPFQSVKVKKDGTINAPGIADLKGGLVVMLTALTALEQSPYAENIGWEVLINPDEEIGSTGSDILLKAAASRNQLGLIYEPALADGTLAGARKGSGNFHTVIHGKSAHAGRAIDEGRNAVLLAAEYIQAIYALHGKHGEVTVNPARLEGGSALNVVPDLAVVRFNVRVGSHAEQRWVEAELKRIHAAFNAREGFSLTPYGSFTRPPKTLSAANEKLFHHIAECGKELGQEIRWQPTGGCCDGNNLAAYGLPNVDSLGVRGGQIHSDKEFMIVDSLTERAALSALLLMKLGAGEIGV